eukprot:TRINITY_DN5785_c0_g1_i1.p1 TRINITY_DN5785_c0_g1~~TRINITY_DN5785_c0_g1_i1.p1  ORF type:complete len:918 (+),score=128.48 TRINITY_DN5785_c0_g1_i1:361-2754(+)
MEERLRTLNASRPDIMICPPEILHYQLDKYGPREWSNWENFLRRLRFVIIDEAHSYRGLFGGNVANLIRRLRGIVAKLNPVGETRMRFIIASATVGNPLSLAQRLLSKQTRPEEIAWVGKSGAATQYHVYLTHVAADNPRSAVAQLIEKFISAGLTGIVFTKTVAGAQDLQNYIRDATRKDPNGGTEKIPLYASISGKIAVFYASQNVETKRKILADFTAKRIMFLISTSALEAGVDFPSTDVCIVKGFPSSKLSFFQRSGRAGRSGPGVTIFVPSKFSGSDFYYTEHPQVLLDQSSIENIAFNANYPTLLRAHVAWHLREYGQPHRSKEDIDKVFHTDTQVVLDELMEQGIVRRGSDGCYSVISGVTVPEISFRGGDGDSAVIKVVDAGNTAAINRIREDAAAAAQKSPRKLFARQRGSDEAGVIEKVSGVQIFCRVFPGALFNVSDPKNHEKRQKYQVSKLELENGLALLHPLHRTDEQSANEKREATISSCVTLLQHAAAPQRQKFFTVRGQKDATLTVTFSWSQVEEKLLGYQIFGRHGTTDGSDATQANSAPKYVVTGGEEYEVPFLRRFEAPAIKLEFSPTALALVREAAAASYLWMTRQENLQKTKLAEAEMENHVYHLKKQPEFVVMHTLLHQLINVVPLMTMSASEHNTNDVREHSIGIHSEYGFLVDNANGGNGACECLFDNFEFALEIALERTNSCSMCSSHGRRGFGCAACLYEVGSRCTLESVGLVASFGVELLRLAPIVPADPLSQIDDANTVVEESLADDEDAADPTILDPSSPLRAPGQNL